MKSIVVKIISLYQKYISPDTGIFTLKRGLTCVFYPSCSEYTKQAVIKYGVIIGLYKGFFRILRCHPWQKNHIDPLI